MRTKEVKASSELKEVKANEKASVGKSIKESIQSILINS